MLVRPAFGKLGNQVPHLVRGPFMRHQRGVVSLDHHTITQANQRNWQAILFGARIKNHITR